MTEPSAIRLDNDTEEDDESDVKEVNNEDIDRQEEAWKVFV